jgi:hypothetical protein
MSEEQVSFLHALCVDCAATHDHFDRWLIPSLRQVDYGEIASVIVKMHDIINDQAAEVARQREINKTIAANVQKGAREGYEQVISEKTAEVARLTAELQQVREAERWVKVQDRLPERDVRPQCASVFVSALVGEEVISPVWYCYESAGYFKAGKWYSRGELVWGVTHWRPLPSAPEQEE